MTTLKEFEDALREQGMHMALAILQKLRERDRTKRSVAPARRIAGRKMTPELARRILELHATTEMTQQEIAFELGVNQGRVNEVIKRGKWLDDNPAAPEAIARDKAKARMAGPDHRKQARNREVRTAASSDKKRPSPRAGNQAQLLLGDL
ncbi:sigma factor-like helix-turn-helix DNA-binding protein [Microvirga splendida]|uniref:RNA polymerase subunit sigma-70 n=1 Tax=Microvirga splendida TaxID=2795727 RepID=A0ABS0XZ78_9HYPH|nr:sigma factor-like helix-turn-helix DNA-binding protein [Microvirga splendida]MBJ6125347.1 RNA polymerase subunit sigma-70 [Microvirga splendida]